MLGWGPAGKLGAGERRDIAELLPNADYHINFLAGAVQIDAIDGEVVGFVVLDSLFLSEMMVGGIGEELEVGQTMGLLSGQTAHAVHIVHDEAIVQV